MKNIPEGKHYKVWKGSVSDEDSMVIGNLPENFEMSVNYCNIQIPKWVTGENNVSGTPKI